jgi:hypothetical protein
MDYIFFAFSSLCAAFSVILAFLMAAHRDMQPRLLLILLAGLAGVAFYYLEITFFSKILVAYYLANTLPQAAVAILLGFCLWRSSRT